MSAQPMAAVAPDAQNMTAPRALDTLAEELAARGWITRPHAPAGRVPCLFVQNPNPGAAVLAEHIYAGPGRDGTWWYWWPWADRIMPTRSADEAADVIVRVLRAADSGTLSPSAPAPVA